jgi:hypothetical protein
MDTEEALSVRLVTVFNPGTRTKLGEFDGHDFEYHDRRGSIGGVERYHLLGLIGEAMARQFDLEVDGVLLETCRLVRRAARFEFVYGRECAVQPAGDTTEFLEEEQANGRE